MQLQGKTDQRFVENAFKLFRDCLGIRSVITAAQFLDQVGGREGRMERRGLNQLSFICIGLRTSVTSSIHA